MHFTFKQIEQTTIKIVSIARPSVKQHLFTVWICLGKYVYTRRQFKNPIVLIHEIEILLFLEFSFS